MELRRFNDAGVAAFRGWLAELRNDPSLQPPLEMLEDANLTGGVEPPIHATPKPFANRCQFAEWLHDAAVASGTRVPLDDVGFWSWLTLLLFDQVSPLDSGRRTVRADPAYVLYLDYRRVYRHRLATAYRIYYMHRDDPSRAKFLLDMPLSVHGELTEQLAGRQDLIGNTGIMSLANRLFLDPGTGRPKSGAGGAAANRLGKLLNQYLRTWDITIMNPEDSTQLLPAEFDRFRTAQ